MSEKSILVVSPHFAPENTIAALRVTALVRILTARGWRVRVVTRYPESATDTDVTTIEVPDKVAGWRRRIGASSARRGRRLGRRLMSGVCFRLSWPDEQVWWSISAERRLRHGGRGERIVLASGPPFSCFLVASRLARRERAHLVLDYRDLWTRSTYYEGSTARRWLDTRIERSLVRQATGVVTVSAPLAEDMSTWRPETPVLVVPNGFDPDEYEAFDHRPAAPTGRLRVIYLGELYAGKRDPRPFFEALTNDDILRGEVSAEFYGSNVHSLSEDVSKMGLSHCVKLSPRVSHREALDLQNEADVLLLLLWNDPREAGVYSGKLFEYVGARRAVLMLGYPHGVAADMVRSREIGVVANEPSEIGAALRDLLARKRAGLLTRAPERTTAGLSRAEQFGPLLDYLERLVSSTSARHSRTKSE